MVRQRMICRKKRGSMLDLLSVGLCVLALSLLMLAVMNCVGLIQKKISVGQITRRYLLRMETVGYLTDADRASLTTELQNLGLKNISLQGTTLSPVCYGEVIHISVKAIMTSQIGSDRSMLFTGGLYGVEVPISEHKESTAKQ